MHIGFLQTRFSAVNVGGGEIHTEHLARALRDRGHDVTIYTAVPNQRRSGISDLNVREYPVPLDVNPVAELVLAHRAWDDLQMCDVVTLTDGSAWKGVELPVPTVMIFHFVWHGWVQRTALDEVLKIKPQALLYRQMEGKIAAEADRLVAISRNMYEDIQLIDDVRDRIRHIPNGVDINRFKPSETNYDDFTVHFQGRLVEMKNPSALVEAAHRSERPWQLTVGGKGPLREKLEDLVEEYELSDRVKLLGYLDEDELLEHYRRSHVYALPSSYEGMPLTVLEAAACGTPIVASPRAATDFVDEEVGWVVSSEPARLADCFDRLFDDPETVRRRGRMARKKAEQYSWDAIAEQYESLYDELV